MQDFCCLLVSPSVVSIPWMLLVTPLLEPQFLKSWVLSPTPCTRMWVYTKLILSTRSGNEKRGSGFIAASGSRIGVVMQGIWWSQESGFTAAVDCGTSSCSWGPFEAIYLNKHRFYNVCGIGGWELKEIRLRILNSLFFLTKIWQVATNASTALNFLLWL